MSPPLTQDEIVVLIRAHTENVFSTMLGIEVKAGLATAQSATRDKDGGVISFVGFAGQWSGSGTIRCSSHLACVISGKLLLTDFESVNEEVLDAIGEMTNMIIGNFKDDAAQKLGPLGLSTPTVICGDHFQARNWQGQSWTTVPFDCEGELLEVMICLVPSRALSDQVRPTVASFVT
jgi:chemotaxis protein CheX